MNVNAQSISLNFAERQIEFHFQRTKSELVFPRGHAPVCLLPSLIWLGVRAAARRRAALKKWIAAGGQMTPTITVHPFNVRGRRK